MINKKEKKAIYLLQIIQKILADLQTIWSVYALHFCKIFACNTE